MLFELNEEKNRVEKEIERKNFKDLKMGERDNLQEIIANNPKILGEDLLIIQKEFHDFDDTNERLDLLALDKSGNLVIIENKLDDSGKDVTWQIIKYSSYVSVFTKEDVIKIYQEYLDNKNKNTENNEEKDAEERLRSFFGIDDLEELILNEGDISQRLILVANNFRKEITSSVLWLSKFGLKIQCIKATPFLSGNKTILNMEQIIPVKDIEDYTIGINKKEKEIEVIKEKYKKGNYTEEYHLENVNENVKKWYFELWKIASEKKPELEKNFSKQYLAFKLKREDISKNVPVRRDTNIIKINFNNESFYLSGPHGYNTVERIGYLGKILNKDLSPYFSSISDKEIDYGRIRFKVENEETFKVAKKIINFYLDNLEEELKKRNKKYYLDK